MNQVTDEIKRRIPQTEKILALLKEKPYVTNVELNRICFRYSARILELRNDGHDIQRKYLKPGVYKYWLVQPKVEFTTASEVQSIFDFGSDGTNVNVID